MFLVKLDLPRLLHDFAQIRLDVFHYKEQVRDMVLRVSVYFRRDYIVDLRRVHVIRVSRQLAQDLDLTQ